MLSKRPLGTKGSSESKPVGTNEEPVEKDKSSVIATSTSVIVDVLLACVCIRERRLTRPVVTVTLTLASQMVSPFHGLLLLHCHNSLTQHFPLTFKNQFLPGCKAALIQSKRLMLLTVESIAQLH